MRARDFKDGGALNAGRCEACGHHVVVGHVVTVYADVGEVHMDCENPYSLPTEAAAGTEDDPKAYVLLGFPVKNYPAPLDHSSHARNMVKKDKQ